MKTLMLWLALGVGLAYAQDYTVSVSSRTDLLTLPSEVKAQVPALRGAYERIADGTVTFQRETGDFTDAEKAQIDAVVAAHDPQGRAKAQARQRAAKASGDAKLKVLGLTDEEIAARP